MNYISLLVHNLFFGPTHGTLLKSLISPQPYWNVAICTPPQSLVSGVFIEFQFKSLEVGGRYQRLVREFQPEVKKLYQKKRLLGCYKILIYLFLRMWLDAHFWMGAFKVTKTRCCFVLSISINVCHNSTSSFHCISSLSLNLDGCLSFMIFIGLFQLMLSIKVSMKKSSWLWNVKRLNPTSQPADIWPKVVL